MMENDNITMAEKLFDINSKGNVKISEYGYFQKTKPPTMIYLVVVTDRRTDDHIEAFATEEAAMKRVNSFLIKHSENEIEEQNTDRNTGWLYCAYYNDEGDHIRVEQIELQE